MGNLGDQSATLAVVASNAHTGWANSAAFVCDGTADEVQINAAIVALSAAGGKVVLSEGTFTIAAAIVLADRVTLQGQGRNTKITLVSSADCNIIEIDAVASEQYAVRDLLLDGNKANQASGHGISFSQNDAGVDPWTYSNAWPLIENVFIAWCKNDGLRVYGTTQYNPPAYHIREVLAYECDGNGFNIGSADVKASDCLLLNNGLAGIQVGVLGSAGNFHAINCGVSGSGQITAASGIGFRTTSTRGVYLGCLAQDNIDAGFEVGNTDNQLFGCKADSNGATGSRQPGFEVLAGGDRSLLVGCQALNRSTVVSTAREQSYGFVIASGATDVVIANGQTNNHFGSDGDSNDGAFTDAGTRSHIQITTIEALNDETPAYLATENQGATSVADNATITHGLTTTPTGVILTCSTADEYASVSALAATTFTVQLTKHDGSAGTTATVYWRAWV